MFIKAARIKNFKLFQDFLLASGVLNIPDSTNEGSGLTVFVGENGTGKTTLLDALALPLIGYKGDQVEINDFYDINLAIDIKIQADTNFTVKKTMPRGSFEAKGFHFYARLRGRDTSSYPVGPLSHDIKYVPDSSEGIEDSSVELRASVENPYTGPRFKANDYLFIDKNRNKQLESGMFSSTRFDRILDNFNFQYLKTHSQTLKDPNAKARAEIGADAIDNAYLRTAFDQFKALCGYDVDVSLISNMQPYTKAFLTYAEGQHSQLPVARLGNGYQMLLAILCQYHLSLQSGKQLIIFIDEIELHLHHKLQKDLANLLLEISKSAQVIITTHSPMLLKSLRRNSFHKINVLKKQDDAVSINPLNEYVLPTPSINESAYVALGIDDIEYFNELYSYLMDLKGESNIANFDRHLAPGQRMIEWANNNTGRTESLSVHSCIRHKIHHPENTLNDAELNVHNELLDSIEFLREQITREV